MSDIVTDLWEFKYKPQTFDEIILDERIKPKLKKVLDEVPNMTIAGPAGVGKGTFMDVLKEERHPEIMKINGSDETGVDAIRDRVKPFAESMGFSDKLKIVYINEADRLSPNAQDMLRDLIENVHDLTRFILLCNYPERISPEIFSRCPLITIPNPPIKEIAKKCIDILKSEGVKYDGKAVINVVKSCYPDIRNTINTLKYNVVDGVLAEDAIIINIDQVYQDVVEAMKTSDPSQVRKVLRSNPIDYVKLYEYLYKLLMVSDESVFSNDISAVLHITEGAYRNDMVAIKEISFMNMYLKLLKNGCI
jgi:DNA polymerase III delta prime subunit